MSNKNGLIAKVMALVIGGIKFEPTSPVIGWRNQESLESQVERQELAKAKRRRKAAMVGASKYSKANGVRG